jgi:hypothetical protein
MISYQDFNQENILKLLKLTLGFDCWTSMAGYIITIAATVGYQY